MEKISWKPLTTVSDTVAAKILSDRLQLEGISVDVRTDTALLGEARLCRIYVSAEQLERAESLLRREAFPDAELDALAMSMATPESE